jgi:O-antigen/teichoic acid export membrane protein
MVLLHSTSELWAKDKAERITTLVSRITRYNLILVVLLSIGLTALANDFVPLYFGSEFETAVLPLILLLPGVIGFSLARPIFAVGQGKGDLRILIVATGSAALLNICLNIVLIPRYGITGAAVATSIGYGSMALFHTFAARQIGFDPTDDLRIRKITVVAVLTGIVVFGVSSVIDSSLISLLVVPPIGFVVYVALIINVGAISPHEIDNIIQRLPDPIAQYIDRVAKSLEFSSS